MLELIALIALVRKNSHNALIRGRQSGWAKAFTIILWFCFELLGVFVGGVVLLNGNSTHQSNSWVGIYLFGLFFAALGGLASWLIAKRGAPLASIQANNQQPPA